MGEIADLDISDIDVADILESDIRAQDETTSGNSAANGLLLFIYNPAL